MNQEISVKKNISDFYITFKLEINKEFFTNKQASVTKKRSQSGYFNFYIKEDEINNNSINNSQNMKMTSIDKKKNHNSNTSLCKKFSFNVDQDNKNNNNTLHAFYTPGVIPKNKKSIFGEEKNNTAIIFNNKNLKDSIENNDYDENSSLDDNEQISQSVQKKNKSSKFSLSIQELKDDKCNSLEEEYILKPLNEQSLVVNNFSQPIETFGYDLNNKNNFFLDNLEENKSLSTSIHVVINNDKNSIQKKHNKDTKTNQSPIQPLIIKKNCSALLPLNTQKKHKSNNIISHSENLKQVKLQPRFTHQIEPARYKNFQTLISLHSELNIKSNKKKYKLKQRQIIKKYDNSAVTGENHQLKFKSSSSIESGDSSQELKLDKQYCIICGDGFR